ncbi:glycosyltransferase [uncultured Tateyamaria sp.]|uniref:glycosyltransferase n=1 Tax=uncultured Tateyamaria sp. TaxID=455651 RepID=UPI00262C8E7E|nr:glycosyltransferase [uncultured Tateyamaria sp.]
MSGNLTSGATPVEVDILILADIRVGDIAAPCHSAAITALTKAGYSIAVAPVISDAVRADPYTVDPDLRALVKAGDVRRVGPEAAVLCTLALTFDARLFAANLIRAPRIDAQHRVVTVERPAALASLDRPARNRLRARAEMVMGGTTVWAPTSMIARDAMVYAAPDWPLTDQDWAPVAPDLTHVRADAAERARPTIGRTRIARARPASTWPDPFRATPLVALRERGLVNETGEGCPSPAPVERWPDDHLPLDSFLAKVDLLANADLAHDDPVPVEALMAISAGVVPCLPEPYREIFGGAAVYGDAHALVQAAIDLKLNPDLMEGTRQAGIAVQREIFAPGLFVDRVAALIGAPSVTAFAPAIHTTPNARVLFYSTNGIGMGHLTRQLAVARRLPVRLQPVFVSHSRAVDTVRQFGFVSEHLPYHTTYGQAKAHWIIGLAAALEATFAFYKPEVVIFDGNVPFQGLLNALARRPCIASVWIRRAMWGAGRDIAALERGGAFDVVVEPLDPAWAYDHGPTLDYAGQTRSVPPVRILDEAERPGRAEACAALGLDPANTNVLVATGSGNNFDLAGITTRVIDGLSGRAGVGLALAEWQIAQQRLDVPATIARLTGYPFAQYLSAFDFAVAAPGYNTFCEHLAAGLPTLWVPNEHAQMDQQIERARYAVDMRCGLMVRRDAPFDEAGALSHLLDPANRDRMAQAGARLAGQQMQENGASALAELVTDLAGSTIARLPIEADHPEPQDQPARTPDHLSQQMHPA